MLTQLREGSTGSLMVFILFGMLIFVFIFFFGPQMQGLQPAAQTGQPSGVAAKVDGQKVPVSHVESRVRQIARRADLPREQWPVLRAAVMKQILDQVTIEQRARAMGLAVGEDELTRYISTTDNPDFAGFGNPETGRFEYDDYRRFVQSWGLTTDDYRAIKAREMLINRYLQFLATQIKVSEPEVRARYDRANRNWELEYVKVDGDALPAGPAPTAEAGLAYANAHADAVKAYFDDNKRAYDRELEVKIRRVTVKVAKDASDATKAEARKKLEGILAEAKAEGADLDAIAKAKSEDYFAKQGGDMGWRAKGTADYELFAKLKKGEFTDIQESNFGLWFARAEAIKPAVHKTLDEVKGEIGVILKGRADKKQAAVQRANALLTQAKAGKALAELHPVPPKVEPPKPLPEEPTEGGGEPAEPPATSPPPPPASSVAGPFSADRRIWSQIPGIGDSPKLARLLPGLTADKPLVDDVIEVGEDAYIVKLKNRTEPTDEGFAKEKAQLQRELLGERQRQFLGSWGAMLFGMPSMGTNPLFGDPRVSGLMATLPSQAKDLSAFQLNDAYKGAPPAAPKAAN